MRIVWITTSLMGLCANAATAKEVPAAPPISPTAASRAEPLIEPKPAKDLAPGEIQPPGYTSIRSMVRDNVERGADDAQELAVTARDRVGNFVKKDVYEATGKFYDWVLTPPPKKLPNPVPSSYCYRSFQDVLCYRQPMPGWEHRLVGYQGTGAAPPKPTITKLLPTRAAEPKPDPVARVEAMAPVFKEPPKQEKSDELSSTDDLTDLQDPSKQAIPTPITSPHL